MQNRNSKVENGTSASLVQNDLLNAVAVVLKEPNQLDYKVKNNYEKCYNGISHFVRIFIFGIRPGLFPSFYSLSTPSYRQCKSI